MSSLWLRKLALAGATLAPTSLAFSHYTQKPTQSSTALRATPLKQCVGGSAASSDALQSSAIRAQVRGVTSEDLTTTVLPVTSAGASFRAITNTGKFHGQMPTLTPSGILWR